MGRSSDPSARGAELLRQNDGTPVRAAATHRPCYTGPATPPGRPITATTTEVTTGTETQPGAAISIRGVSMVFGQPGSADVVRALQDVSLEIGRRELISLIGPSGCGKSTLLRLIGDLLTPTAGTLLVNGKTPRQARLSRDYGIVFQQPVLFDWRTVEENVQLPLDVMKVSKGERRARTEQLLRLVGLQEFARRYPWELSGGMQQRVSIARALSFRRRCC